MILTGGQFLGFVLTLGSYLVGFGVSIRLGGQNPSISKSKKESLMLAAADLVQVGFLVTFTALGQVFEFAAEISFGLAFGLVLTLLISRLSFFLGALAPRGES